MQKEGNDGYELPSSITVTGATLVSWTKSTGTAVIGSITGNVTVTVAATAATYTIEAGTYKCASVVNGDDVTIIMPFTSNGTTFAKRV